MSRWTPADLAPVLNQAGECLRADGGRLWEFDASPRWIVVDQDVWWLTEPEPGSTPSGGLWRYAAEPHTATANTGMEWHGRSWAMIDAGDDLPTVRLLLHEAFHAFWQPAGWDWVTPVDAGDDALSQPGPRAAVIIELQAWAAVLETQDRDLAADARTIRTWRLDQLSAAEQRRQDYLDLWEGICEYSAHRWSGTEPAQIAALARTGPRGESWYRSLCYTTGPVLGYVLDLVDAGWRRRLASDGSLTAMINSAVRRSDEPPADLLDRYGYPQVLQQEQTRHETRSRQDRQLRDRFTTTLWLPNPGGIVFDPHDARHWDLGTFYRTLSIRTEDLRLDAADGAVVTANWNWVGLPAPESYDKTATIIHGPGWRLESSSPVADHGAALAPTPPTP